MNSAGNVREVGQFFDREGINEIRFSRVNGEIGRHDNDVDRRVLGLASILAQPLRRRTKQHVGLGAGLLLEWLDEAFLDRLLPDAAQGGNGDLLALSRARNGRLMKAAAPSRPPVRSRPRRVKSVMALSWVIGSGSNPGLGAGSRLGRLGRGLCLEGLNGGEEALAVGLNRDLRADGKSPADRPRMAA